MTTPRDRTAGLLTHYFRTAFRAAGLAWDADNDAEMNILADALHEIVDHAVQEHAENAPHLYPDGSSR